MYTTNGDICIGNWKHPSATKRQKQRIPIQNTYQQCVDFTIALWEWPKKSQGYARLKYNVAKKNNLRKL